MLGFAGEQRRAGRRGARGAAANAPTRSPAAGRAQAQTLIGIRAAEVAPLPAAPWVWKVRERKGQPRRSWRPVCPLSPSVPPLVFSCVSSTLEGILGVTSFVLFCLNFSVFSQYDISFFPSNCFEECNSRYETEMRGRGSWEMDDGAGGKRRIPPPRRPVGPGVKRRPARGGASAPRRAG